MEIDPVGAVAGEVYGLLAHDEGSEVGSDLLNAEGVSAIGGVARRVLAECSERGELHGACEQKTAPDLAVKRFEHGDK